MKIFLFGHCLSTVNILHKCYTLCLCQKNPRALYVFNLFHVKQSVCTKFYQKFSYKFYSEISIKDCTSLQYTLLDPVYLHNLNATLKDINTVTVFKHTF